MKILNWALPGSIVVLAAVCLGAAAWPSADPEDSFQVRKFSQLPVVHNGRVKPYDTLARTYLMILSGKQTYRDQNDETQPAAKWLLDVMISAPSRDDKGQGPAFKHKVFRITHEEVLNLLGLEPRSGFRYALSEFVGKLEGFYEQANRAQKIEPNQRSLYDSKLVELGQHLEAFVQLSTFQLPHAIPPSREGEEWKTLIESLREHRFQGTENPIMTRMATMLQSYEARNPREFNRALEKYSAEVEDLMPATARKARLEVFFNEFSPFMWCKYLYLLVVLFGLLGFLCWCLALSDWVMPFRNTALWLCLLLFAVHTAALGLRMYLQGRPPVTNLYSSAIFIGWTGILVGIVLEFIFRNGLPMVVCGILGHVSLIIAYALGLSGDTMEMLQAVLDTNFWLATHVTTITFGYTATFLAGLFGAAFIIYRLATASADPRTLQGPTKVFNNLIYGVTCFALFLSFTGTVLGGIWADQSWGRFWGWDPKENGALLIVLWTALILHARWGGMIKTRGMAALAVGGNIVTAWSWFGTNLLGVGLHSYGFMSGTMFWLLAFAASQLAIIGLAFLPVNLFRKTPPGGPSLGGSRTGDALAEVGS